MNAEPLRRSLAGKTPVCRAVLATSLVLAMVCFAAGCLPASSEDAFVGSRSELLCQGVFNLCKGKRASCRVEKDDYLSGQLPGARQFMVETPPGSWNVKISLFFDPKQQPRSPGTDLDVFWYEPGCAEVFHFQLTRDLPGGDLFEKAGRDNVLEVEQVLRETGDHLIEISADAQTRFLLKVDVDPL